MLTAYATQPHYIDHLAPVVAATGAPLLVPTEPLAAHARARHLPVEIGKPRQPGGPVLIAGYRCSYDVHRARPLVLLEHGAGQTYVDVNHMGYAGGEGWGTRLALVLSPGPHAAAAWRRSYPRTPVVEIGCPRLDVLRRLSPGPRSLRLDARVTAAVTFHWRCRKGVETGTAWDDWRAAVGNLAARPDVRLLGHWHPRWEQERAPLRRWWEHLGVETVPSVERLFAQADVLVADNTSLLYEFAATGRPVLCLNGASWRRDVEHGLRFWSHVPGHMLDPGDDLLTGVLTALDDDSTLADLRGRAVSRAYTAVDGRGRVRTGATVRAVDAIADLFAARIPVEQADAG